MTRSIVVGWDGSGESVAALHWALALADRHGTPVRIVGALEPVGRDLSPRPNHSHEGRRATLVQELLAVRDVQAASHPNLVITTLLVDDVPVEALVRQGRDAALLAMGLRGVGGRLSLLAGSTTLSVAARSECTLVAVPRPDARTEAAHGIVVGSDGSAVSEGAVTFAFEQASELRVPLTVVHCWHDRTSAALLATHTPDAPEATSPERRQHDMLADWLAPWSSKFPDVAVDARVVHGNAARSLVDMSRDAQLLVVGCRGLGAVQRAMLGSVSQGVLHLASVPIAVVPAQR